MDKFGENMEYANVPKGFQEVQQSMDRFVEINYQTAQTIAAEMEFTSLDIIRWQIMDIIRNNPPLKTLSKYYRDGREDYLWYSDFYDDISKEDYHLFRRFISPVDKITPANYTTELAKIGLPYFKELINLISLERLCMDYEEKISARINKKNIAKKELSKDTLVVTEAEPTSKPKQKREQALGKSSYEAKLNNKQYDLLIECIEKVELFRRPLKVKELKKLLKGKLSEPLQVNNQKSFVYLFDCLREKEYIKHKWISTAVNNKDFTSFRTSGNQRRYGSDTHYINLQQFVSNRSRNQTQRIHGLIEIDEMMELLEENRDK